MKRTAVLFTLCTVLTACGPSAEAIATMTATAQTATAAAWTKTPTPTDTPTPTSTPTPTETLTPTVTSTPTITPSPTFDFPDVVVNQQAHCRYGPATAYLHAADLYPGNTGTVRGRFHLNKWLYVKFDKLNYFCWVAPSVVTVTGDVTTVKYTEPNLQNIGSNQYGPPKNVQAVRDGDKVTVTWGKVDMTRDDDRGYFLDVFVCQKDAYLWFPVGPDSQDKTTYTFKDEAGCSEPSGGFIYSVDKHGYSKPVKIPWPKP
jgi:hypothetical protein